MAAEDDEKKGWICRGFLGKICRNITPKKFTTENVLYWYIPAVGSISYITFSAHIFNPSLLQSFFPHCSQVAANCLLLNSHLGTGLYLFKKRHIAAAEMYHRVTYCVYGTLLFNFGSVLLCAITKAILPESPIAKTVFGLSTSICLLLIGKEYCEFVDSNCKETDLTF